MILLLFFVVIQMLFLVSVLSSSSPFIVRLPFLILILIIIVVVVAVINPFCGHFIGSVPADVTNDLILLIVGVIHVGVERGHHRELGVLLRRRVRYEAVTRRGFRLLGFFFEDGFDPDDAFAVLVVAHGVPGDADVLAHVVLLAEAFDD